MSVNFNLISAELTDENHAAIINGVKGIEALIPFAVTLPTEVKATLTGAGPTRIDFASKTYEYLLKNPLLQPGYMDMAEFEKDINMTKKLQDVLNHLIPLVNKLSDTFTLAGTEAYSSSRVAYHHVKNAASANVPGASAVAKELGKLFKAVKHPASSANGAETDPNTVNQEPAPAGS